MAIVPRLKDRRVGKPLLLSLLGIAIISPVPLLSGLPDLTPSWLLGNIGGLPILPTAMLLLIIGMVGLAMLCLNNRDPSNG